MKEKAYKVIADYPFNRHFVIGQIIRLTEVDDREHTKQEQYAVVYELASTETINNTMAFYESEFDSYPHIFKPLHK